MKKAIKRYLPMALTMAALMVVFCSCDKEGLVDYHGGNCVNFQKHEAFLSFLGMTPAEMPDAILEVKLAINGFTSDKDRYVKVGVVADDPATAAEERKTTATPSDYKILEGVIKKDDVYGTLKIELYNNARLQNEDLKLRLALLESDDFEPGLAENIEIDITWTQKLVQPMTWERMRSFFCQEYSTLAYKTIIKVTGLGEIPTEMKNEELRVLGRKFGDYVRQYEIDNGKPMIHDDGASKGTRIIPVI